MSHDDVGAHPEQPPGKAGDVDVSAERATSLPALSTSVALRRTPTSRRWVATLLFLLLGVLPSTALPLLWFVATRAVAPHTALVLFGLLIAGCVAWLAWQFVLPRPAPIVIHDDGVHLPWARGMRRLALDEIVVARAQDRELVLIAGVPPGDVPRGDIGVFVVAGRCFVDDDGAARVEGAVRARMARHPDGARLHARLDDNADRQRRFAATRPWVTWVTVAVCVVAFVGEYISGAVGDIDTLLLWGANSGALVRQGEWWRVVTACLLHGSVVHLLMNAASLASTGALVERWLGSPAMAVVLVVSGAGGHLASAFAARAPASVGISGAVFGLLGVLLVSSWRYRRQATGGLRVPASSWLFLIVANALLATLPFLDVVAHGAGFAFGVVAGGLLSPRPGRAALVGRRAMQALAVVCIALVVVAVGCDVFAALRA
jgi:rhomboid protease GluP